MQEQPRRLASDRLRVPMRAEDPSGLIGDGIVEIGPDHPLYAEWATWIDKYAPRSR